MFDHTAFAALVKRKRGELRLSMADVAADVFGNASRKSDISRLERGLLTPQEQTIQKLIKALDLSDADMAPIRAGRTTDQQLDALPTLTREHLINLAYRFQIADAADQSDAALRSELAKRADEYRALQRDLQALRQSIPRLDNVLVEALALLEQGTAQADTVRAMIADARKAWAQSVLRDALEQDAQLAEVAARAALIGGYAHAAFALLSRAADSFAGLDALEPARRRGRYEDMLYSHGLRFGGAGLALAAQMCRDGLERVTRDQDAGLWAALNNNLALALQDQGIRTAGAGGAALLAQAVMAYDLALTVLTRDEQPLDWAMTVQNKAHALQIQTTRVAGAAGLDMLAQAVAAYDAALTVSTKDAYPLQWAATMQNKANALQTQGARTTGAASLELLAHAVAACDAVLTVYTKDAYPVQWAETMQNKAGALAQQGKRTPDAYGLHLLEQARDAFLDATTILSRADHPAAWAMTQENLARVELDTARHPACADPVPHLRAALAHVDLALEVFDPVHMSHNHATATALRAFLLSALDR